MSSIVLEYGKEYASQDQTTLYTVESGTCLVYITHETGDENMPARRLFLCEFSEGEQFPGFHATDFEGIIWKTVFTGLGKAVIAASNDAVTEEHKDAFITRALGAGGMILDYEEGIIEKYRMNIMRTEVDVYYRELDDQKKESETIQDIIDKYASDSRFSNRMKAYATSDNPIYNAASMLCHELNIPIRDYAEVKKVSGRKISVYDIARVSHFVVRDITVDHGFSRKDTVPFIAFIEETGEPVVVVKKGRGYRAILVKQNVEITVNDEFISKLSNDAFSFIRPFPNKPMSFKDIILFGIEAISVKSSVINFMLLLIITLIGLILPYANEMIYDTLIPLGRVNVIAALGGIIILVMIEKSILSIVQKILRENRILSVQHAIQDASFDRVFNLPEDFTRNYTPSQITMYLQYMSEGVSLIADEGANAALQACFSLLYMLQMIVFAPRLAWYGILLMIAVTAVNMFLCLRMSKYEKFVMEEDDEANDIISSLLLGIDKIRINFAETRALNKYMKPYANAKKMERKKDGVRALVVLLTTVAPEIIVVAFYILEVYGDMDLTVGKFVGFSTAFATFSTTIMQLCVTGMQLSTIMPIIKMCEPLYRELPENNVNGALPERISGGIEINNLSFSYEKDGPPILSNLSLEIEPGEYVGIVGSSGCGKSTLMKLLLGFEKPTMGNIYYDGQGIDEYDKRELRKKFGVVLQDGGIIPGSIYDNITVTNHGASVEKVERILEMVGLSEDIDAMPMGLNTVVSADSGTISGGQKQRILIARALINNPSILFFDEATSALDNITQKKVTDSINGIKATKIVIAHRLSTIQACDRIIVLDKGHIIEEGTFDSLMANKGMFYNLAIRQM